MYYYLSLHWISVASRGISPCFLTLILLSDILLVIRMCRSRPTVEISKKAQTLKSTRLSHTLTNSSSSSSSDSLQLLRSSVRFYRQEHFSLHCCDWTLSNGFYAAIVLPMYLNLSSCLFLLFLLHPNVLGHVPTFNIWQQYKQLS